MFESYPRNACSKVSALLVVCALALGACDNEAGLVGDDGRPPAISEIVFVHGGSPTGAYNTLINEELNHAAVGVSYDCEAGDGGCESVSYTFEPACDNGGSIPNLRRIGMRRSVLAGTDVERNEDKCTLDGTPRNNRDNELGDLALVQNFWIYGATENDCAPIDSDECRQSIRQQNMNEYRQFPDLRIVLPMYYGRIQVVASDDPLKPAENPDQPLDERCEADLDRSGTEPILKLACSRIFLGSETGVNIVYGNEVFGRHPLMTEIKKILKTGDLEETDVDGEEFPDTDDTEHVDVIESVAAQRLRSLHILQEIDPPTPGDIDAEVQSVRDFVDGLRGQKGTGNGLLACGLVDAYVISGEVITPEILKLNGETAPKTCAAGIGLRQVAIPEVIIDGMVAEHPYYQKLPTTQALFESGFKSPMPAVTTYLVTTERPLSWQEWARWKLLLQDPPADVERIRKLTRALQGKWQSLMLINPDLVPLQENIYKRPANFHTGAEIALQEAGLLGDDWVDWQVALIGLLALLVLFWRTESSYDRLGEKDYGSLSAATQLFKDAFRIGLILIGTIALFILIVALIREFESEQAFIGGLDDPISRSRFEEVLLWMFTFVSSGYENNVFPQSTWSRLVVSVFAIVGLAVPLWAIVAVLEKVRERRLSRARGGEYRGISRMLIDKLKSGWPHWSYRSRGMLLICGWNSKAPGLIYTLTCPDSPYPGMVNIVADMDVEYPVNHWGFNKRRVRFYRGDAAHRSTLERAEAGKAQFALILADDNSGAGSNSSGILTALALGRMGTNIFVSAEMTLTEGDRKFSQAHVDDVVDPKGLTRQMLAVACFDRYVLEFVLDALSPDEHCEWYSIEASELRRRFIGSGDKLTVADYSIALQKHGISVVGICTATPTEVGDVFSPDFKDNAYLDPLISVGSLGQELPDDSYLVCAAEHPRSFRKGLFGLARRGHRNLAEPTSSAARILPRLPESSAVLVIGSELQSQRFGQHLEEAFDGVTCGHIGTDDADVDNLEEVIVKSVMDNNWTHIVMLSSIPESHSATEFAKSAVQADSETVLRANLIRTSLKEKGSSAEVVAEVNNTHSRQLAKDARVTTVVPSSLLIERILARLVNGRGHVSEMLAAMLKTEDGTYLRSVVLTEDHPLVGMTVSEAMSTWFHDGKVLGLLPDKLRERYRNDSDDFDLHFIMCPTGNQRKLVIEKGDVAIVLAFPVE